MTMETLSKMGVLALVMMVSMGMGAANIVQPSTDADDQPHVLGVDDSLPVEADFDLSEYDIEEVDDVEVLVEDAQNSDYNVTVSTESDSLWEDLQDDPVGFVSEFFSFSVTLTEDDGNETVEVDGDVERTLMEDNDINVEDGEVTLTVTLEGTFETENDENETVEESTTVEDSVTVDTDVPAVEVTGPEADAEVELDDEEMAEVEAVFDSVATHFSAVYTVDDGNETEVVDMTEVSEDSDVFEALGLEDVEEEENITVTVTGHEESEVVSEVASQTDAEVDDTSELFNSADDGNELEGDLQFTADSATDTVDFTVEVGEDSETHTLQSGDDDSLEVNEAVADGEEVTITASTDSADTVSFDYTVEDVTETVEDTGSDEVTFSVVESTSVFTDTGESIITGDFDQSSSAGLLGVGLVAVLAVIGGVVAYRRFV